MSNKFFSFKDEGVSLGRRQQKLYAERAEGIKKLCFLSTTLVSFGFICIKVFHKSQFFWDKPPAIKAPYNPLPLIQKRKEAYTLPLLVNLKGKDGPQLTRIHVHITYKKNPGQKNILSQKHLLKKQALFVLSGQSAKAFQHEKSRFEKQILSQLNVFLSKDLIEGVRIQTHRSN